ncbi:MAG: hypothetical protein ABFC63_03020 [Thermoguttaceae bacterium]
MKPWQSVLVGFTLLAAAGCRTDPAITLLERDNFRKEQEIWRLRGCIEDLQDELNASQRRAEAARPSSVQSHGPRGASTPPATDAPDMNQPNIEMPQQAAPEVPDELKRPAKRRSPAIRDERGPDSSTPGGPNIEMPGPDQGNASSVRPTSASEEAVELIPFEPTGDSRQAASITLDPRMTGGISTGSGAGDQGLLVVVEPRDARGRTVDAPAEMSVVAYDPAIQDESGHAILVARWDFTREETAALFRRDGQRQAIHLAGGWPQELPKHGQLHVFVRYITADGRNLEADREVEIAISDPGPTRPDRVERVSATEPAPIARREEGPKPRRPQWSPNRQ